MLASPRLSQGQHHHGNTILLGKQHYFGNYIGNNFRDPFGVFLFLCLSPMVNSISCYKSFPIAPLVVASFGCGLDISIAGDCVSLSIYMLHCMVSRWILLLVVCIENMQILGRNARRKIITNERGLNWTFWPDLSLLLLSALLLGSVGLHFNAQRDTVGHLVLYCPPPVSPSTPSSTFQYSSCNVTRLAGLVLCLGGELGHQTGSSYNLYPLCVEVPVEGVTEGPSE